MSSSRSRRPSWSHPGGGDARRRPLAAQRRLLNELAGHTAGCLGRLQPRRHALVTASDDGTARIWDAASGEQVSAPPRPQRPGLLGRLQPRRHARRHRQSTTAPRASGTPPAARSSARLRRPQRPGRLGRLQPGRPPRRHRLATTAPPDLGRRQRRSTAGRGHGTANSAAFSPDGTRVVTASATTARRRIWDAASGETRWPAVATASRAVAAFSPDGTRVVTATEDGTARIWDAASGKELGAPARPRQRGRRSRRLQPRRHPRRHRQRTTARRGSGTPPAARSWRSCCGHSGSVDSRRLQPRRHAASSPPATTTPRASGTPQRRAARAPPRPHTARSIRAAFSPDGTRVVTACDDGTARIWDAASGEELAPPARPHRPGQIRPPSAPTAPASSPPARQHRPGLGRRQRRGARRSCAATPRRGQFGRLQPRRRPRRHRQLATGPRGSGTPPAASSSRSCAATPTRCFAPPSAPTARRVVTASVDGTARIWDAASGEQLDAPARHERGVPRAAFSPDGTPRRHRQRRRDRPHLGRRHRRAARAPPRPHGWVASAAFSPDGTRVVTASLDGTARIWDAASGEELAPLRGHTRTWSSRPPSAPTAPASSPPATTGPRASGTPPAAGAGAPARPHETGCLGRLQPRRRPRRHGQPGRNGEDLRLRAVRVAEGPDRARPDTHR